MDNFIPYGKTNGYFYPTELKRCMRSKPDGRKIVTRLQSEL